MIDLDDNFERPNLDNFNLENYFYSYFFYEIYYDWYVLRNKTRRYYFYKYMPKVWKDRSRYKLYKSYSVNQNYWYASKKKIIIDIKKKNNITNLTTDFIDHNININKKYKLNSLTNWF